MKEIIILSGKGGSGKTSIAACFALLADKCTIADCDVDAADMHLLLNTRFDEQTDFFSGYEAEIGELCVNCGKCIELCRFDAIDVFNGQHRIDPVACEGCGVCVDHCPVGAIDLEPAYCGELKTSQTDAGPMAHAQLGAGGENSGRLVTEVRKQARMLAEESASEMILIDGPPGTGCSTIAALSDTDLAVIVAEPSISGIHDAKRVFELCRHFKTPVTMCCNKADINPQGTEELKKFAKENDIRWLGEVEFDPSVTKAQLNACPVISLPDSIAGPSIRNLWENLFHE